MIISKETLTIEANRTGFRAEILEKVIRLIDLLNAFAQDDFLKSRIVLKGGTALNLFYFDLKRLSVDIDLNYMGSIDRNVMLSEKPMLLAAIEKICNDKKYQSIRKPSEHAGGKWIIRYKSELIPQGQLEIDLNFIARALLWPINYLDSKKIGDYQATSIPVLDYYDLIGGKLTALFSRHKSRDLFDTYTIFSQSTKLDRTKIKLAFIIYSAATKMDPRKISLDHLNFEANELKNMLLPVLREEDLKETKDLQPWSEKLINVCKKKLADIIDFDKNELEFLENIVEHGQLIPELLTTDEKLVAVINSHPVLLWKCMNVREYKRTMKEIEK